MDEAVFSTSKKESLFVKESAFVISSFLGDFLFFICFVSLAISSVSSIIVSFCSCIAYSPGY